VILTYTLNEKEYLDARRAVRAHLARGRLLFRIMLPLVVGAALAGVYSLFVTGNLGWGVGLCLASAFLLVHRMFWWRWRVRRSLKENPGLLGPFTLELTQEGTKLGEGGAELPWTALLRYYETRDLFLLQGPAEELCILPKRALPSGDMVQWTEKLRTALKGKGRRENPDALLLKLTATWAVGALFVLVLFAGSIHNFLNPTFRLAAARTHSGAGAVLHPEPAKPAPINELKGQGAVYFVPLDKRQNVLSPALISYYREKYGLELRVLAPVPLPLWTKDESRHQLVAEELVEAIKRAYPQLAANPDAVMIGVTDEDMYISQMNWSYAFGWRQEERFAIVSTARMDPAFDKAPADPAMMAARARKMLTKEIGLLYYRLQPSQDYASALYDSIGGVEDLDDMGEDYLTSDTLVRAERRLQDGDPCFTIRHYDLSAKSRPDSGILTGCSGTEKQLNLEIMEVDLRYGLFLDRRTEFYALGPIPLQFTRVLRMQDSRARAFGIGGNHTLNIFPVGNRWPFTWIDLIMADGGRVHYKRSNWGFGYWDANYSSADAGDSEFSGSKISWNWPGWKLAEPSGRTYYFPDAGPLQRPEQTALLAIEDGYGDRLNLPRDPAGNLIRARSSGGREPDRELDFKYDQQNRITQVGERGGPHTDYSYDAAGRLVRVIDPRGQTTNYAYDAKNRMIAVMQDGKPILSNEYDAADRVVRQTLLGGRTYTFKYSVNRAGQVTAIDVVDSAGITWQISMSGSAQYTMKPTLNRQTSISAILPGIPRQNK